MSITTGQFFSYILLGINPTALGRALDNMPTTPDEWGKVLAHDIEVGNSKEDASVVARFQKLLTTYPEIFTALLTPVYVSDNTDPNKVVYVPVPLAKVMKDQISRLGSNTDKSRESSLNVPWSSPPHPPGQFVWRLIDMLSQFDEQ